MTDTLQKLLAVSALIETLERQCRDGLHGELEEMRLRRLVVRACRAFELGTIAERGPELLAIACMLQEANEASP